MPDSVFYNCIVTGDMHPWKVEMDKLSSVAEKDQSFEQLRQLAFARYGYMGYLLENQDKEKAKENLQKLEQNVIQLEQLQSNNYEIMALHGAVYGLWITLQKWKAPTYGIKSMNYINDALEGDSINGYIYSEKANMTYFMPVFVGGGRSNAIPVLEKAVQLMDNNMENKYGNWLYLHLNTLLARWYIEEDELQKAKKQLDKILTFEPNCDWIKEELIPKLEPSN